MANKEYPELIIKCIDKHFPKGDKRRGDALVLQAIAYVEGREMKLKEVGKVIDERIEHYDLKLDTKLQVALEQLKRRLGIK